MRLWPAQGAPPSPIFMHQHPNAIAFFCAPHWAHMWHQCVTHSAITHPPKPAETMVCYVPCPRLAGGIAPLPAVLRVIGALWGGFTAPRPLIVVKSVFLHHLLRTSRVFRADKCGNWAVALEGVKDGEEEVGEGEEGEEGAAGGGGRDGGVGSSGGVRVGGKEGARQSRAMGEGGSSKGMAAAQGGGDGEGAVVAQGGGKGRNGAQGTEQRQGGKGQTVVQQVGVEAPASVGAGGCGLGLSCVRGFGSGPAWLLAGCVIGAGGVLALGALRGRGRP